LEKLKWSSLSKRLKFDRQLFVRTTHSTAERKLGNRGCGKA
jgi:hypothetical protein